MPKSERPKSGKRQNCCLVFDIKLHDFCPKSKRKSVRFLERKNLGRFGLFRIIKKLYIKWSSFSSQLFSLVFGQKYISEIRIKLFGFCTDFENRMSGNGTKVERPRTECVWISHVDCFELLKKLTVFGHMGTIRFTARSEIWTLSNFQTVKAQIQTGSVHNSCLD